MRRIVTSLEIGRFRWRIRWQARTPTVFCSTRTGMAMKETGSCGSLSTLHRARQECRFLVDVLDDDQLLMGKGAARYALSERVSAAFGFLLGQTIGIADAAYAGVLIEQHDPAAIEPQHLRHQVQHLMQYAVEKQALADQPHDLLEQQQFLRMPECRRAFAAS